MDINNVKKKISNSFKLSGFTIKSDASLYLAEKLIPLSDEQRNQQINTLTEFVQKQDLPNANIELSHILAALKESSQTGCDENETVFSIINVFEVPKYEYKKERKKFVLAPSLRKLLPDAQLKATYIRDRYKMLMQRTSRHELFSPAVVGTVSTIKKFQLKHAENLLSTSKMDEVVCLGLLTQLTEGKYYVEDPTGVVPLDLTNARFHSGLFCEGCFVLAEGKWLDGTLKVSGLGFPPPEPANSSRAYFGNLNTWGGTSKTLLKYSKRLGELERMDTEATFVFLSDCWLDNPLVMEKIKDLLEGYDSCPPIAIILMGPFSTSNEGPYALKQKFSMLGDILSELSGLKEQTDIILVPSTEDPASANILPRPPLPEVLVADFKKKYPRVLLATNPCRIQYCTQQIVVCRADLLTKLCRNTLHFPMDGLLEEHFARTLVCQGTLAPFNPITFPTYWDYDSALSLYPLPDLIVIGDPSQGFQTTQQGCTIVNAGSFPKSKFSFKVYVPFNKTVEDSEVP